MIVDSANLGALYQGFNTSFNKGMLSAPSRYKEIAMLVPSMSSKNVYAWMGQFPKIRDWIGDRVIKSLATHDYTITNRLFESTVSVPRTAIEDDEYGVFSPIIEEMGRAAGEHPDELVFRLLDFGFNNLCYDGQHFFDTDHPVGADENTISVSNYNNTGSGNTWYLLDTSRPIKPMLFQERLPYKFTSLTAETDENVFRSDEYVYGIRARANAGFGLWQLAYATLGPLDAANYSSARTAMMSYKSDEGRPLGVVPNKLVVGPALEQAGRKLVNNQLVSDGTVSVSNEWAGSVELVVVPWL